MRRKKKIRDRVHDRLIDVFFSTVEIEAGPIKRLRVRALVLIILIPMVVASAIILKYYGVF